MSGPTCTKVQKCVVCEENEKKLRLTFFLFRAFSEFFFSINDYEIILTILIRGPSKTRNETMCLY